MLTKAFRVLGISSSQIHLLLVATLIQWSAAQNQSLESSVSPLQSVIKNDPIVIHTRVDNYDQPTLDEYRICHENRDNCLQVCQTAPKREDCEAECPTCPKLLEQNIVIQGINDTDYRAPPVAGSGNTTNIIRLTNEIRNIIENNLGNITTNNENNIHIHQNVSTSGGKFGLGYNQNGSCCIVVRAARSCESRHYSTSERCHHKRHRVCGDRCIARVMYAQRITKCEQNDEDGEEEKCHETITYVPYNKRAHGGKRHSSCRYSSQWPFVSCSGDSSRNSYMAHCQRCYQLPYINVIQQRVPSSCLQCYNMMTPVYVPMMPFYSNQMFNPSYRYGSDLGQDGDGNGWRVDQKKCSSSDTVGCSNEPNDGSGDGNDGHSIEIGDVDDFYNELENTLDTDDLDGVDVVRRRRQSPKGFRRSSYSRRHRHRRNQL